MKSFFLLSLIFVLNSGFGQDQTLAFPTNDTLEVDTVIRLSFTDEEGKVTYKKDKDLDEITAFVSKHKDKPENIKMTGFRVQIYFNENKSVALGQKANFISQHSEHKAYLDYLAPNYRVRVGNFRTKLEAEKLKQELLAAYPTCIIIQDVIELPALKNMTE